MRSVIAIYTGGDELHLVAVSRDPALIRHAAREVLHDLPPPVTGDALAVARLGALQRLAAAGEAL